MWYGTFCLLAVPVSLFAGGLGSVLGMVVAVILFAAAVIAVKIEVKDATYLWGLSFSLLWLGATVGLSWPVWRWPLIGLGLLIAVTTFLMERRRILEK